MKDHKGIALTAHTIYEQRYQRLKRQLKAQERVNKLYPVAMCLGIATGITTVLIAIADIAIPLIVPPILSVTTIIILIIMYGISNSEG